MRRIAVLDAPSNLGLRPPTATSVPGCAKAPGALRDQGLLARLGARDAGCLTPPRYDPGDWRPGDGVAHAAEISAYSRALADRIGAIIDGGEFPVVLGGDCSILIGAGIAMHRLGDAVGGRIGLVFVDGHSDFRHPGNASYVGAAAGEDLALVTGRGQADLAAIESRRPYFRDIDVVVLGIRAQDEYRLDLQAAGIVTRPVPALRAEGAARSAQWARDQLVDCAGYWVHLDVDVLDPAVMPAVDAPDPGGIAFPELELLLSGLVESPHCLGVEITVFDPDYDPDGRYAAEITSAVVGGLSPVRTTSARPDLVAARRDLAGASAPAAVAVAAPPSTGPDETSPAPAEPPSTAVPAADAAVAAVAVALGEPETTSAAVGRDSGVSTTPREAPLAGAGWVTATDRSPSSVPGPEESRAAAGWSASGEARTSDEHSWGSDVKASDGQASDERAVAEQFSGPPVAGGDEDLPSSAAGYASRLLAGITPLPTAADVDSAGVDSAGPVASEASGTLPGDAGLVLAAALGDTAAAGNGIPVSGSGVPASGSDASASGSGASPSGGDTSDEHQESAGREEPIGRDRNSVDEERATGVVVGRTALPESRRPDSEAAADDIAGPERSTETVGQAAGVPDAGQDDVSRAGDDSGEPTDSGDDQSGDDGRNDDQPAHDDLDDSESDRPADAVVVADSVEEPARGYGDAAIRLLARPLGPAPLLDSEPLPATRPGMLRPRPPADPPAAGGFGPPAVGTTRIGGFPPGAA